MDESNSLSAYNRRQKIILQVQETGSVRVTDLMETYQVSDTAIRRDLNILEERGVLRRIHGGAVSVGLQEALTSFQSKIRQCKDEKCRIGRMAANMVKPGESIILDSGTTALEVARALPNTYPSSPPLTIVTNSIPIIIELQHWRTASLNIIGGILLPDYQATVGPQAVNNLRRVQVDKAFIGCDGLTISHGLTTPHMLVAEIGRVMVEVAREVIVVVDSSKLGRVGFTQIVRLNTVHTMITDEKAPQEILDQIRDLGINIVLA